jgi:hypothetical protein
MRVHTVNISVVRLFGWGRLDRSESIREGESFDLHGTALAGADIWRQFRRPQIMLSGNVPEPCK